MCLPSNQGGAGHRPEGHLLQDPLRADAHALLGFQPAGGERQPRLLGPSGRGAALLHDLHLWTIQGKPRIALAFTFIQIINLH